MANKWTNEQLKAIEEREKDILVSAAAGSGKTAVLVERIIEIITSRSTPVDIDKLLVLTFTKAAANEMRERISARLMSLIKENPKDIRFKNQLTLLNKAQINTIHSFCMDVIRKNYASIGIDPSFRVADDAEKEMIKNDVLDELFEEKYAANDKDFLNLLESLDSGVKDTGFKKTLIELYEFVKSLPFPDKWLDEVAERYNVGDAEFEDTFIGELMVNEIKLRLEWAKENIFYAIKTVKRPGGPVEYLATFNEDMENIEDLERELGNGFKSFQDKLDEFKFPNLARKKKDSDETLVNRAQELRKTAKKDIDAIKDDIIIKDIDLMKQDIADMYPFVKGLVELVKEYDARFDAAKRKKLLLDYNDLEHYCLKALVNEDGTVTDCAKSYQNRFYEILTDEYQDSNMVQEIILSAVSKGSNRFMVGDVKQSIYKFRKAKPEIFMEKYNKFSKTGGSEIRIDLFKNFRSRKNVLDGINYIFENIMTPDLGEIVYDDDAKLFAGADFAEGVDDSIVFDIIETQKVLENMPDGDEKELIASEIEAIHIAGRIKELMASGFKVTDKSTGELKPLMYKDIAIISRVVSTITDVYTDVFERLGIPLKTDSSSGFFNTTEIMTMVNFLNVIDNPRQDIPLISILYSPIYGLEANDLMKIRLDGGKKDFYSCVTQYAEEGEDEAIKTVLKGFIDDISALRKEARRLSIAELILKIYSDTGYFDMVGAMTDGKLRQANLRLLVQKAEGYEANNFHGLFNFIKYVEKIKTIGTDIGEAKMDSGEENAVSLVTVHKSKGLEYPVVFVACLGKKFNKKDGQKEVLYHQELGIGVKRFDHEKRVVYETAARRLIGDRIIREGLSEEVRVLYVALTRARDKLFLVGTVDDADRRIGKWSSYLLFEKVPYYNLLKELYIIDWIGPCMLRHKDGRKLLFRDGVKNAFLGYDYTDDKSKWEINVISDISKKDMPETEDNEISADVKVAEKRVIEKIEENIKWEYPFAASSTIPANVSISELKRIYQEKFVTEEDSQKHFVNERGFEYPDFEEHKEVITSAKKGTVMHAVMENIDFGKDVTAEYVDEVIGKMVSKNLITEKEAASTYKNKILNFFKSDIYCRIRKAKSVCKEEPFAMTMDSREVFGNKYGDNEERVLLHGIIDCYFEEEDGLVLLDYKTDYVKSEEEVKNRYKIQLDMYKRALEKATGKNVKEVYIYLFGTDSFIDMR